MYPKLVEFKTGWWYTYPSEKYERQLGWWPSQLNGKINNVPNHQPENNVGIAMSLAPPMFDGWNPTHQHGDEWGLVYYCYTHINTSLILYEMETGYQPS